MSKFTLRDAQQGIESLQQSQTQILDLLRAMAPAGHSAPVQATVPNSAASTAAVVRPIPGEAKPEAESIRVQASIAANTTSDSDEPLPVDRPDREGPCWASNTLRTKHGLFPQRKRRKNGRTGELEIVNYDVSPANRAHFMHAAAQREFGIVVTLNVPDGKGGETTVQYPAVCALASKQYSSFDHGLYGQVKSVNVTLPDGSEFVLSGQVTLSLKKRTN